MEAGLKNKTSAPSITDESVRFSHVTSVAAGWMLDFWFVSLCRRFKEGKLDGFSETLSTFKGETFTARLG